MRNEKLAEYAKNLLRECQESNDQEMAHIDADDVLCQLLQDLGYNDVVEEYDRIGKWYA